MRLSNELSRARLVVLLAGVLSFVLATTFMPAAAGLTPTPTPTETPTPTPTSTPVMPTLTATVIPTETSTPVPPTDPPPTAPLSTPTLTPTPVPLLPASGHTASPLPVALLLLGVSVGALLGGYMCYWRARRARASVKSTSKSALEKEQ